MKKISNKVFLYCLILLSIALNIVMIIRLYNFHFGKKINVDSKASNIVKDNNDSFKDNLMDE